MKPLLTTRSAASLFMLSTSMLFSIHSRAQALSGTYTINASLPAGGTNFNSFNEAVTQLMNYGVTGAVVFNVDPAVYAEQVIIPEIAGASAVNTITFNGNEATLKNYSSNSNERAVLKLNGADYITINGLNISAGDTATAAYGYGVQLINDADHNQILNCNVSVPFVYSPSVVTNYAGIVINSSAVSIVAQGDAGCDGNRIADNTVTGGYHGIALVASGAAAMINDNKVTGNTILDFYNAGIYIDGNKNTLINANDISRPNRTTGALFYGIQLNNTSYGTIVSNNKIHDPFGGTAAYVNSGANGIYFANVNATADKANVCFNNILYNFKAGSIIRGIWISGSPFSQFVHNTLSLDDNEYTGFTSTTGFEITGSADLTVVNNVVSIKRVGSSFVTRYGINVSPVTGCTFANNDILLAPGSTYYFGKYGSVNCADAPQWAVNSGDNTSISADPVFVNAAAGNLKPTNTALVAAVPSNITTDILGLGRNAIPTMGAFEINGTPLPVKMSLLEAHLNAVNEAVLIWQSYNEQDCNGYEIQRSYDGKNWQVISFAAAKGNNSSYSYNDKEMPDGKNYYRLKRLAESGTAEFSNVAWLVNASGITSHIGLYPNPAQAVIHISIAGKTVRAAAFTISDAIGKTVKEGVCQMGDNSIDISDLPEGVYSVNVIHNGKSSGNKFVKHSNR